MTPFGARLRALREERGLTLTRMAADLGLSAAYLSALEHGKRARPTPGLVRQICGYLSIIWDDADELQALAKRSRPKVSVDTGGLSPLATEFANLLADRIGDLDEPTLARMLDLVRSAAQPPRRRHG
jgi:transcriptional regulator with XRE-family HTH domain